MQLPNSRTGILFVSVVLVVSTVIGFNTYKEKNDLPSPEEKSKRPVELTIRIGDVNSNNTDTDGDGLLDWQEVLAQSDPNDPDTDGDGTEDGTEVDEGRDPTIPGPDDLKTENNFSLTNNTLYENVVPGTLTDEVSKNLAANYFNFKQNNEFGSDVQNNLINQISGDVVAITAPLNIYNESDILIVNDTEINLRNYGNALGGTQSKYFVLMSEIPNNDPDQYLVDLANSYTRFENEVLLMAVPDSLSGSHIDILNNLRNISASTLDLKNFKADPVKSLFAIQKWQGAQNSQDQIYGQLIIYFRNNDIIFDNSESGWFWEKLSNLLNV